MKNKKRIFGLNANFTQAAVQLNSACLVKSEKNSKINPLSEERGNAGRRPGAKSGDKKNLDFKAFFLISVMLHILIFTLISPEFGLRGISYAGFPRINFLSITIDENFFKKNFLVLNSLDPSMDFFKKKIAVLSVLPQTICPDTTVEQSASRQTYIKTEPKVKKLDFPLPSYKNLEITGPLKKRLIVSKASSPKIPTWISERVTGPFEIKIWVDKEGDVAFSSRVTSSGSYTLDILGTDYVKTFKFVPSQESFEWGIVKICFEE